ncbi:MAG TPA: cytochrome C [Geobacter sp.]|nr:cytochrome C [Geobacter sp.]
MRKPLVAYLATAVTVLFLVGSILLPDAAVAEPFKCSACHKDLIRGAVGHKPVAAGQCLRCHQQFSDNHPLGKDSMGFIVQKEKLCAVCHGQLLQKKVLHKPVGQGKCTDCHMAHSSDHKSLLKDRPPALCYRCHPKEHFSGAFGHLPVTNGECLSCHDAHQSDSKSLLKKPGSELCFQCHDPNLGVGKSVHGPIKTGECIRCHEAHASANRKLLKGAAPTELYRPFSTAAFPLCFSCHDPELASANTESATNFRNGVRNLHAVHVNKPGKGRSCRLCHNPHASAQDRLIHAKAPGFGTWDIPIRYQATGTGGSCSVGCHKTFRYDRVKAVEQQ